MGFGKPRKRSRLPRGVEESMRNAATERDHQPRPPMDDQREEKAVEMVKRILPE